MYVCIFIFICIYVYLHVNVYRRQAERPTDRGNRDREGDAEKIVHRKIDRQRHA